ncbi:hypothetical protein LTR91_010022 [Friedmanniomyces endolithicus]|uniref:Uncharacterized protein n=1 Tax=Friedmanniomyces endolithicus TaxID=329885 RepID=A0AAN6KK48_9PEZI|nr:hypothetical protein LTR59_003369 [Friedmanniomyces endolithicus]KAK0818457.1 hypothetical protein LTR38_001039 [Friedmanniomyces endolithicus]KAK0863025.1 hypothetical protein LTS02_006831 [Friedmanniomyces endolithicus]KAK0914165.1 hypothetical protein LTR02_001898 [Friedmanniomyces endolithicus]KAK0920643.1 hypothetical protein LTR57_009503 [Friedmanniomyces endolithicus]
MNVGPLPLAQPGSRGAFAFDPRAAYPYQQPAQHHALTAQSPVFSAQTRTSQAYSPGPQSGYDGGHAAMASTGGAAQAGGRYLIPRKRRTISSIILPCTFFGLTFCLERLHTRLTSEDAAAQPLPYYTTAPYSQSVPAQAPTGPQPQLVRHTASASPQPRPSPHAVSSSQQTPPNNNKYPMAAPPLPRSPANQQAAAASQQGSASPSAHPTPQSPGSHSREQQRVALLLDINTVMLHEVNRLQAEGKGGATTPQIQAQMKAAGQPADLASEEYTQVLRRVQANLGYLMPVAQNDAQKTPRGPAYMSPPAHMPQLQPKFDQLRELFPDWQGFEPRASQSSMSPGPAHGGGGVNGTTPVQA